MNKNISDRNGRAFEYCIVRDIYGQKNHISVEMTNRAKVDQYRDKQKYNDLNCKLKQKYDKAAKIITNWVCKKIDSKKITVDRLSDDDAKKGDKTDIKIIEQANEINLSIKHNHRAVKHQRPLSLMQSLGFNKNSKEDLAYRKNYKNIINKFKKKGLEKCPNVKCFKELKKIDQEFINNNLYFPICEIVTNTINKWGQGKKVSEKLFNFLFGSSDFYKIICTEKHIEIVEFAGIPKPNQVKAVHRNKNYVMLSFDNGFELSLRLHTASSKFGSSVKFDTQIMDMPVAKKEIIGIGG